MDAFIDPTWYKFILQFGAHIFSKYVHSDLASLTGLHIHLFHTHVCRCKYSRTINITVFSFQACIVKCWSYWKSVSDKTWGHKDMHKSLGLTKRKCSLSFSQKRASLDPVFKIHFNFVIVPTLWSHKWYLPMRSSYQNFVSFLISLFRIVAYATPILFPLIYLAWHLHVRVGLV
jgi:hypothetical protein